jgi:ribonuclease E
VEIAAAATDDEAISEPSDAKIEISTEEAAPAEVEKPKKPARRRSRKAEAASAEQAPAADGEGRATAAEAGPDADSAKAAEPRGEKPAEPVVVSSGGDETKPRKTGWWQRKSFF